MASVAIPLIASFVVQKVGESQGWDPRMTAVLGAVAGFGAGSLVSAGAAVAASGAASSAANAGLSGTAATTGAMAGGRGVLGTQLAAQSAARAGGSAWGYGAAANAASGARAAAGSANAIAAANAGATPSYIGSGMSGFQQSNPAIQSNLMSIKAQYPGVNVMDSGSMYANAPVGLHKPITMGDAMGNEIDKWFKDPVDPKTGKPTGKLSAAKNFGVSAL